MAPRISGLNPVAWVVVAAGYACGSTANAQQETSGALGEITVTATKVGAIAAQDTPVALTVLSGDDLSRSAMSDLRDIVSSTPSLTIGENSGLAQVYIRGIGTNQVFAGGDPSSTVHIDGVYHARPQGTFNNFLDVERIEVLRGPQGTLYGRNSVGGTINVVSRAPSLTEVDADVALVYGDYDFQRAEAAISGPLVRDRFSASIAGQITQRDGYRENIATDRDVDDEDSKAARAQLRWQASSSVEATLRADYFKNESAIYDFDTFLEPPTTPLTQSIFGDYSRVAINYPNSWEQEGKGASLDVAIQMAEAWSLKSLTAYRENFYDAKVDSDGSEIDILHSLFVEDQSQFSQEFNIVRKTDSSSLLFGAFYMDEDIDMADTRGVEVVPAGIAVRPRPLVNTTSWAVFAQGTWNLTEAWSVTVGGRYTDEEKDFDQRLGLFLLGTDTQLADLGFPAETGSYSDFTPKVGVEFRPSDDVLLYASVTEGFKSGGFSFTAPAPGGYKPETVTAYEVGVKSDLMEDHLRLNASAFYYDYEDLQVLAFIVPGSADVTNAASATVQGAEVEATASITPGFEFSLGVTYLDATYDEYPAAPTAGGGTVDAAGNTLNYAPELSAQAGLDFNRDFSRWTLYASAQYAWQDEVFFTADNNSVDRQDSYGLLNASLGLLSSDERWEFALWGHNLTDEDYITWSAQYTPPGRTGHAGPPLNYGVRVAWRY
jgi:iron complex outermembrane receptor protein